MAKKNTPAASTAKAKSIVADAVVTPVRNTVVPPRIAAVAPAVPKIAGASIAPAKKSAPSYDAIALRAYYIWRNGGGSSFDNWLRAERELSV